MTNSPCKLLTIRDAFTQVPTPDGKRFASVSSTAHYRLRFMLRVTAIGSSHSRDEIYFVAIGSGQFVCGETRTEFSPTDLLFVEAGVEHRFENFTDDLAVWVLFYGPEGGEE